MLYGRAFLPEIQEMVDSRDFKGLREAMVEFAPADAADLLTTEMHVVRNENDLTRKFYSSEGGRSMPWRTAIRVPPPREVLAPRNG